MPHYSYFCHDDGEVPVRPFSEDAVTMGRNIMLEELKAAEDRIKRYMMECKQEIVKHVLAIMRHEGMVIKGDKECQKKPKASASKSPKD